MSPTIKQNLNLAAEVEKSIFSSTYSPYVDMKCDIVFFPLETLYIRENQEKRISPRLCPNWSNAKVEN